MLDLDKYGTFPLIYGSLVHSQASINCAISVISPTSLSSNFHFFPGRLSSFPPPEHHIWGARCKWDTNPKCPKSALFCYTHWTSSIAASLFFNIFIFQTVSSLLSPKNWSSVTICIVLCLRNLFKHQERVITCTVLFLSKMKSFPPLKCS